MTDYAKHIERLESAKNDHCFDVCESLTAAIEALQELDVCKAKLARVEALLMSDWCKAAGYVHRADDFGRLHAELRAALADDAAEKP